MLSDFAASWFTLSAARALKNEQQYSRSTLLNTLKMSSTSGMVLDSREHTHTTSSESHKLHPRDPHQLTANFLNSNLKSSDAHVVHRIEADVWSPLLPDDDRYKVCLGAIAENCVVSKHPHLQGPSGYCDLIRMFKAACPNLSKSIHMMGECSYGDATFVFSKWSMGGDFTGDKLWGIAPNNKRFHLNGMSMCKVKGAQIVEMDCTYDLMSLADTDFPILSSSIFGSMPSAAGGFLHGGAGGGGIVSTVKDAVGNVVAKAKDMVGSGAHSGSAVGQPNK